MDHSALFVSVKERDIEQLHKALGPALEDFGNYRTVLWDHAADGILTSLKKIPGVEGYDCLRWAESLVNESHKNRPSSASDACYAEYVYQLRAELLGKALERITDFEPADRPDVWKSVSSAMVSLVTEVTEENMHEKEWLLEAQSKVAQVGLSFTD